MGGSNYEGCGETQEAEVSFGDEAKLKTSSSGLTYIVSSQRKALKWVDPFAGTCDIAIFETLLFDDPGTDSTEERKMNLLRSDPGSAVDYDIFTALVLDA